MLFIKHKPNNNIQIKAQSAKVAVALAILQGHIGSDIVVN
ncbi:hypothetical protein HMPREF9373_0774 [Psychrobacter sp. 1501(2011)]|nr:hypothetical protein HMPREF9373_0774 [Psychrobacter sp. 1501(2011)]